jgi:hypothetical protein
MTKRAVTLAAGVLFVLSADARAQSAGEALRSVLFRAEEGGGAGALTVNATQALYGLLLGETTTFPIGSSAGGFTWTFDPDLRVPIRRSQSFGPMFAERPFTTGARKLNVGAFFQHTKFVSIGGQPLTELTDAVSYNFGESSYTWSSSVAVAVERVIVSATYGVHDKVDIGVIVPVGEARVTGSVSQLFIDHTGRTSGSASYQGSSFGLGDVVVRAKAALVAARRFDGAVALDLRLPTGEPDALLGTGRVQAKAMFIAASTLGRATPHVNVGYTFGGSGMMFGADNRWTGSFGDPELIRREPSPEFGYTVGVDVAATPRLTVAADVIARVVKNSANMRQFNSPAQDADRVTFLEVLPGSVHLMLAAAGVKFSVGSSWLATASVLFPLTENGIAPAVTPVFGFERAF